MSDFNPNDFDAELLAEMRANGLINDEVLEQMAAGEPQAPETVEEVVADEGDLAALEGLVEAAETREALYEAQESVAEIVEAQNEPGVVGSEGVEKPARKARASRAGSAAPAPRTPRAPRMGAAGSPGAYVASFAGAEIELEDGVMADTQALIDGIAAVKIKEKAVNALEYFHQGKRLSVFTRLALDTLKAEGKITGKRLVEVYQAADGDGYSIGTARSQSQQLHSLLERFRIVTRVGGELVGNPNSPYFRQIAGA